MPEGFLPYPTLNITQNPQDPGDVSQMTDLVPWMRNVSPANDGLHAALSGVFWWAWNSNSGAILCQLLCEFLTNTQIAAFLILS